MKILVCNIGNAYRAYKVTTDSDPIYLIDALTSGTWESVKATSDPGDMANLLVRGGAAPDHDTALAMLGCKTRTSVGNHVMS